MAEQFDQVGFVLDIVEDVVARSGKDLDSAFSRVAVSVGCAFARLTVNLDIAGIRRLREGLAGLRQKTPDRELARCLGVCQAMAETAAVEVNQEIAVNRDLALVRRTGAEDILPLLAERPFSWEELVTQFPDRLLEVSLVFLEEGGLIRRSSPQDPYELTPKGHLIAARLRTAKP